jgi:hypothetical protein
MQGVVHDSPLETNTDPAEVLRDEWHLEYQPGSLSRQAYVIDNRWFGRALGLAKRAIVGLDALLVVIFNAECVILLSRLVLKKL